MNSFKQTYRFIALIMAALMFFTSVGFVVDMHYCSGELRSISFDGKAKTCHEGVGNDEAPVKDSSEDRGCCSNKSMHIQFDQDQKLQITDIEVGREFKQFVIAYVAVFFLNHLNIECNAASYTQYKSPLILRDIPVLIQSFLL